MKITFILRLVCVLYVHVVIGESYCRARYGELLTEDAYKHTTCSLCYQFLIKPQDNQEFAPFIYNTASNEQCLNHTIDGVLICPTHDNRTAIDYVCKSISSFKCNQWEMCCESAWECCLSQELQKDRKREEPSCPMMWDGWECWDRTGTGSVASNNCPAFLQYSPDGAIATKNCTDDGVWVIHTNYDQCLNVKSLQDSIDFFKKVTAVRIGFNSLGIILLCSSITMFLLYRQLRIQQRIKLHVHLFLSLLIRGIIELCWDVQIRYRRLEETSHDKDEIECKTLYILSRFGWSAPFFWMLCEGFFLHRLLIKTFERQKTLMFYYIFGWGAPVLLIVIYLIIKIQFSSDASETTNNECWLDSSSSGEQLYWIIFAPTVLCLLLNLLFFINILRILVRQVRTLPSEPSNFRKAIKATFILIPLFGLHQFFLIYQPKAEEDGYEFFQMTGGIINNAQGIMVSLIFCFLNGEVMSHIKSSYNTMRLQQSIDRRKSVTSQTNTRRFSASSVNINQNSLPYVSSFHDLSDTLNLAENNNIPMEDLQNNGIVNQSCETKDSTSGQV